MADKPAPYDGSFHPRHLTGVGFWRSFRHRMIPATIKQALLESYVRDGGINHLDGVNLPSQDCVA